MAEKVISGAIGEVIEFVRGEYGLDPSLELVEQFVRESALPACEVRGSTGAYVLHMPDAAFNWLVDLFVNQYYPIYQYPQQF